MMGRKLVLRAVVFLVSLPAWTQESERVPDELVEFPEMILHNGKIVTVDDHSFSSRLGTVAEGMAIRGEKVLAVGTNDRIRRLAGPQTKLIDLKGKTVLPGIVSPHDHPYDWIYKHEAAFKKVISDDSVIVARFLNGSPSEQVSAFDQTLREAVAKARPGQFIFMNLYRGEYDQWKRESEALLGREITKQKLDQIAPNNPVLVLAQTPMLLNGKALEAYKAIYPNWQTYSVSEKNGAPQLAERNLAGAFVQRRIMNDVMWGDRVDVLAKLFDAENSFWAGYGVTTVGSSIEGFNAVSALALSEKSHGRLPIRWAWAYSGPIFEEPYFLKSLAAMIGTGSDYFWFLGALPETVIATCSTASAMPAVKARENCVLAPGMEARKKLYEIIKAGGRVGSLHTSGDQDVDYYMDAIEEASRDAGFTLEQIRAKRHVFDHCGLAPRPDQIPRIKRLGIIVSCNNIYLYQDIQNTVRNYGPQVARWVTPRKSLVDAGVMTVMELDRPLGHTVFTPFHYLEWGITRKAEDGKVYAPEERVSREIMLKIATVWGGYYLLREDKIGSLEPGKLADFMVIDRDYLTIPEQEISSTKVLMTTVGGEIVHLVPSFASEVGRKPVGAQVELGHVK